MRHALLALLFPFLAAGAEPELEIRVVYDNTSADGSVPEDWGFAAVVTHRGRRILFDSGTKPELFMANLARMGVEPATIERAMISHEHPDHRNGIQALYAKRPGLPVFFLDSFYERAWREAAAVGLQPARVREPFEIVPGAYSTGLVEGSPDEQSLAIETSDGVVLVVGCSHPGIVKIVETARRQRGVDSIALVVGGFHMFQQDEPTIRAQVERLRALGVRRAMPAHCSGDLAKAIFREAYGAMFDTAGAGKTIRMGQAPAGR